MDYPQTKYTICPECGTKFIVFLRIGEREFFDGYHGECPYGFCGYWHFEEINQPFMESMTTYTDTKRINFLLQFIHIEDIGDDTSVPKIWVDYLTMEGKLYPHIKTLNDDVRDVIDRALDQWSGEGLLG